MTFFQYKAGKTFPKTAVVCLCLENVWLKRVSLSVKLLTVGRESQNITQVKVESTA